jgi:hypothetical protein
VIKANYFYPFQTKIIVNETDAEYYVSITENGTYFYFDAQFLVIDKEGQMIPTFSSPLNSTVITTRVQTQTCYPYQGGEYYRQNITEEFGVVENEIVATRATDKDGRLHIEAKREWTTRIEEAQSIVVTTAKDGIILCSNIDWNIT